MIAQLIDSPLQTWHSSNRCLYHYHRIFVHSRGRRRTRREPVSVGCVAIKHASSTMAYFHANRVRPSFVETASGPRYVFKSAFIVDRCSMLSMSMTRMFVPAYSINDVKWVWERDIVARLVGWRNVCWWEWVPNWFGKKRSNQASTRPQLAMSKQLLQNEEAWVWKNTEWWESVSFMIIAGAIRYFWTRLSLSHQHPRISLRRNKRRKSKNQFWKILLG